MGVERDFFDKNIVVFTDLQKIMTTRKLYCEAQTNKEEDHYSAY